MSVCLSGCLCMRACLSSGVCRLVIAAHKMRGTARSVLSCMNLHVVDIWTSTFLVHAFPSANNWLSWPLNRRNLNKFRRSRKSFVGHVSPSLTGMTARRREAKRANHRSFARRPITVGDFQLSFYFTKHHGVSGCCSRLVILYNKPSILCRMLPLILRLLVVSTRVFWHLYSAGIFFYRYGLL